MSIKLMTAAWELSIPATDKIILLALADWASDDGHCWPSMGQLVKKSGLTDRAIRAIVGRLVDGGHLSRQEVIGKGVNYFVHPGRQNRGESNSGGNDVPKTPEGRSANTSGTTIPKKGKPSSVARATDCVDEAVSDWNALADELGTLPHVQKLSPERRTKLKARLRDHGIDGWREALGKIRGSPFLRGDRTGRATNFDFLLQPSSFLKVIEGNYDERTPINPGGPTGSGKSSVAAGLEVLELLERAGGNERSFGGDAVPVAGPPGFLASRGGGFAGRA